MIGSFARRTLHLCLQALPVSVRDRLLVHLLAHASESTKFRNGLPTVAGFLENLRNNGFRPETIIDIGAYVGEWSRMVASIFPFSQLFMIDANPENEVSLKKAQRQIGPRSEYAILLLGHEKKEAVPFYQHGSGSSVMEELTSFARREVALPMATLDGLLGHRELRQPLLLKLDVQGFELEVLRGGRRALTSAEVVILEVALLPYNQGAPLFAEVLAFMQDASFAVYDFCGHYRRQTDQALCQTDVVFVKQNSALRAHRKLWLHEP